MWAAHDRDVNAAMNILAAGRADGLNDRGARGRPAAMPAPRYEAAIRPDTCQINHRWGWRAVAVAHPPQMPPMDVLLLELGEHMALSASANADDGYKGNLG